jgi:pyruvate dehydrogenase E1 component
VAQAAVAALAAEGKLTAKDVSKAIELYGIDASKPNPIGA